MTFLPLRFLKFVLWVTEVKAGRPDMELMEDIRGSRSIAGAENCHNRVMCG